MRIKFLTVCIVLIATSQTTLGQQLFGKFRSDARSIGRTLGVRQKPPSAISDPEVETLARELDWLEAHIDKFGSVVAKQPDIWGESRLSKYRREYESEMAKRLDKFTPRDNARITRDDVAFLASATGLSRAIGGTAAQVQITNIPSATPPTTTMETDGADPENEAANPLSVPLIGQTINLGDPRAGAANGLTAGSNLDVTEELNQRSRYLNHLHQLRRINSGDDTSDAPGYSLNLVRIPISINPGRETRRSYGAKVTITARPHTSNTLLPETFKNLTINDVVDQLALPILKLAEDPELRYTRKAVIFQFRYKRELQKMEELAVKLRQSQTFDVRQVMEEIFGQGNFTLNFGAAKAMTEDAVDSLDVRLTHSSLNAKLKAEVEAIKKRVENHMNNLELLVLTVTEGQLEPIPPQVRDSVQARYARLAKFEAANLAAWKTSIGSAETSSSNTSVASQAMRDTLKKLRDFQSLRNQGASSFNLMQENSSQKNMEMVSEIKDDLQKLADDYQELFSDTTSVFETNQLSVNPVSRRRRSSSPIPQVILEDVIDQAVLVTIASEFTKSYHGQMVAWNQASNSPKIHLMDVRHFLRNSLEGAYRMMATLENRNVLSNVIDSGLATHVKQAQLKEIEQARFNFMVGLEPPTSQGFTISPVMRSLAWPLVVEMALLNDQLNKDVHDIAVTRGDCGCHPSREFRYYLPLPENHQAEQHDTEFQAAAEQFQNYVGCRWPIHVFHVDPVNEDQNVSESSQIGRELAVAAAVGVASGQLNVRQANQFVRQYREQIDTIGLNRTISGFSHGNDTFGWTFRPRVQSQPNRTTLAAFGETLLGRGADANLRDAALEPGMREVTAIVLMPSFVPYCDFDVSTRWFRLDNPRSKEISNHQTLKLSRSIKYMKDCSIQCASQAHLYRDGEIERLLNRVEQLEHELPYQSMKVQIPYENTLGGFELFNNGVTDLGPELVGWYGAPGIQLATAASSSTASTPTATSTPTTPSTSIFIVGQNFNILETVVIAGGIAIAPKEVTLISPDVIQVNIPSNVRTVNLKDQTSTPIDRKYVAIHASTPYGVTGHLHVPVVEPATQPDAAIAALEQKVATLESSPYKWDSPVTLEVVARFQPTPDGKYSRSDVAIGQTPTSTRFTLRWEPPASLPGNLTMNQLKGGLLGRLEWGDKMTSETFWVCQPGLLDLSGTKTEQLEASKILAAISPVILNQLTSDKTGNAEVLSVKLKTWVVPVHDKPIQVIDAATNVITNEIAYDVAGELEETASELDIRLIQRINPVPTPETPKLPAMSDGTHLRIRGEAGGPNSALAAGRPSLVVPRTPVKVAQTISQDSSSSRRSR